MQKFTYLILGILFFLTACGTETTGSQTQSSVIIKDNVVVMDDATDIPDVSNAITVSSVPKFKIGDVLVGKKDGGYVKRVISIIENNDGTFSVETEDANLEDVFVDTGEVFNMDYEATEDKLQYITQYADDMGLYEEDLTQAIGFKRNIAFCFEQQILKDPTTGSNLTVIGDVATAPYFYFDAKIKKARFTNVTFTVSGNVDTELTLITDGIIGASSGDVQIASFGFAPLVIWVGWVPITFTPVINFYVGAEAYTNGRLTFNINNRIDYNLGAVFDGKNWRNVKDIIATPMVFTKDIYVGANGRVWLKGAFGLRLMRISNLQVTASPYSRFNWDMLDNKWYVWMGFNSDVEYLMRVLSYNIIDWDYCIYKQEWLIYQN